jgi:ribosome biogenesis GTPase
MLAPDRTAVLLGSSGAGKSTLLNRLLGEERQRTSEVRADDARGRHTTTSRELVELPGGGAIIDSPGLRAVGVTDAPAGDGPFADIAELARGCRFNDCTHTTEPGCAVLAAVEAGELDPDRLASYLALVEEGRRERELADARLRSQNERAGRTTARALRQLYRDRDSGRKQR